MRSVFGQSYCVCCVRDKQKTVRNVSTSQLEYIAALEVE